MAKTGGGGPEAVGLRLDEREGVFRLGDEIVPLRTSGHPYEALGYLYRRQGEIVWADELIAHLYGERALASDASEEQRLEKTISRVRQALGPAARGALTTIRRGPTRPTGYRLVLYATPPGAEPRVRDRRVVGRRRAVFAALAAASLALAALILFVAVSQGPDDSLSAPQAGRVLISGRVTSATTGAPLAGVRVHVLGGQPCCRTLAFVDTDPDGRYSISVGPGGLIVQFSPDPRSSYVTEYWPDQSSMLSATRLTEAAGGEITGIDAALEQGRSVEVTVTDRSGGPAIGTVRAFRAESTKGLDYVSGATQESPGLYRFRLRDGAYQIGLYSTADERCCEGPPERLYPIVVDGRDQRLSLRLP